MSGETPVLHVCIMSVAGAVKPPDDDLLAEVETLQRFLVSLWVTVVCH